MDPISSLAATAVAALAPYLAKAAEKFAEETGKAAADKIGVLYQALKTRFENKPAAGEALADLEANPNDDDSKAALRRQLTKQMEADPAFKDTVQKLLDDIDKDEKSMSFLVQVYGGHVKNITQIAGKVEKLTIK
jgi:hypothetical protein